MKIIDLIKEIEIRPYLFFENKSITYLKVFIDGFILCQEDKNIHTLNSFQDYVNDKYNDLKPNSWNNIILLKSKNEEDAFNTFFVLFNDFLNISIKAQEKTEKIYKYDILDDVFTRRKKDEKQIKFNERIKIAKRMLENDFNIKKIAKITNLSIEIINKLSF